MIQSKSSIAGFLRYASHHVAVVALLALTACEPEPECDPGNPGFGFNSPNGEHVARLHESFCGAPGASDGWTVGVRRKGAAEHDETPVFITFDYRPDVRWISDDRLEIELTGVSAVNLSYRKIDGIQINYVLKAALTEASMKAELEREKQRYNQTQTKDFASELGRSAEKRYATFISWAKDYGSISK